MNRLLTALTLGAVFSISGCATVTEAGYYWGGYSSSLYNYTKEPSDETRSQHLATLEDIVEESRSRNLRVPPGIHAELGYIRGAQGNDEARTVHYEAEIRLYPESRVFLERLTSPTPAKEK